MLLSYLALPTWCKIRIGSGRVSIITSLHPPAASRHDELTSGQKLEHETKKRSHWDRFSSLHDYLCPCVFNTGALILHGHSAAYSAVFDSNRTVMRQYLCWFHLWAAYWRNLWCTHSSWKTGVWFSFLNYHSRSLMAIGYLSYKLARISLSSFIINFTGNNIGFLPCILNQSNFCLMLKVAEASDKKIML